MQQQTPARMSRSLRDLLPLGTPQWCPADNVSKHIEEQASQDHTGIESDPEQRNGQCKDSREPELPEKEGLRQGLQPLGHRWAPVHQITAADRQEAHNHTQHRGLLVGAGNLCWSRGHGWVVVRPGAEQLHHARASGLSRPVCKSWDRVIARGVFSLIARGVFLLIAGGVFRLSPAACSIAKPCIGSRLVRSTWYLCRLYLTSIANLTLPNFNDWQI